LSAEEPSAQTVDSSLHRVMGTASSPSFAIPCAPKPITTSTVVRDPLDSCPSAYHLVCMGALRDDLDLTEPLLQVRNHAAAWIPSALDGSFRRRLRREVDAGPFRPMRGMFGKVEMEIEGYDVAAPMDGFPLMLELSCELSARIKSSGARIRGLATWTPNEIGVARYRPGSIGITPHLDGKWYRRLVAVITVYGRSRFAICRSRVGEVTADWRPGPGDLILLRAPGLGGLRDGRPFHLVGGPTQGVRCSLGLRMSVDPPS
jgi:hypothetical protein